MAIDSSDECENNNINDKVQKSSQDDRIETSADVFRLNIENAIKNIRQKGKRPDKKAIYEFVLNNYANAINVDQNYIEKCITALENSGFITNKPTQRGDSYFINEKALDRAKLNEKDTDKNIEGTESTSFAKTAELTKIKNFFKDEIYKINERLNETNPQKCDYGHLTQEIKHLQEENASKNLIIKQLLENIQYISCSNKANVSPINQIPRHDKFQYPKYYAKRNSNTNYYDENVVSQNRFTHLQIDPLNTTVEDDSPVDTLQNRKNYVKTNINTNGNVSRPQVVINQHPENQHVFREQPQMLQSHSAKQNIVIFSDSIVKGIRPYEFNKYLTSGTAKFKSFPGATSKELLHYVEPTLEQYSFNTAIIHVGVNDIINNTTDELSKNIERIAAKCTSFGITKIIISSIVFTRKTDPLNLTKINDSLKNMCEKTDHQFIENSKITEKNLFRDGLHLVESGKRILANNFIDRLNFLCRNQHPYPRLLK